MNYVVGFLFNESLTKVLLIEKNRPAWQAGFYNGIGGKIEATDYSSDHAMIRELREETGIELSGNGLIGGFECRLLLRNKESLIHVYKIIVRNALFDTWRTMTDETIQEFYIDRLPVKVIPQLNWLIPFLLDTDVNNNLVVISYK